MSKFLGGVMVLMALVLAVAPVFTDCQSQGKLLTTADGRSVSMKCHWRASPKSLQRFLSAWQEFTPCVTGAGRRRASPVLSAWLQA